MGVLGHLGLRARQRWCVRGRRERLCARCTAGPFGWSPWFRTGCGTGPAGWRERCRRTYGTGACGWSARCRWPSGTAALWGSAWCRRPDGTGEVRGADDPSAPLEVAAVVLQCATCPRRKSVELCAIDKKGACLDCAAWFLRGTVDHMSKNFTNSQNIERNRQKLCILIEMRGRV
jgi:hypothetical protein